MAQPRFALDANVMIAAVCWWHDHHERAVTAIERRLALGEPLTIPAPALVEAYSVLTRLPAPHRLLPADAWHVLETSFVTGARVVASTADESVNLLRTLATREIGGGRTYDALIAECARTGGAGVLLTFNTRHFDPAPAGLFIVEP